MLNTTRLPTLSYFDNRETIQKPYFPIGNYPIGLKGSFLSCKSAGSIKLQQSFCLSARQEGGALVRDKLVIVPLIVNS